MSLYAFTEKTGYPGPKGLVLHIRHPGQRWCKLVCFGNKSHYRQDGTCSHTDLIVGILTDYGKRVTKIEPFGGSEDKVPKKYAGASLDRIPVSDPVPVPPSEEGKG